MNCQFVLLTIILSSTLYESASSIFPRVAGGRDALKGEIPYIVNLALSVNEKGFDCGGTIISNHWILTAAHCLNISNTIVDRVRVDFGITDQFNLNRSDIVKSEHFIIHNNYSCLKDSNDYLLRMENDIALIYISKEIEFDENIQPAKLPSDSADNYENRIVTMSGWGSIGMDLSGNFVKTHKLQRGEVSVISNSQCRPSFSVPIHKEHICLHGISACKGDSGGPIVLENTHTIVGITSFAKFFCESNNPSVFTRVSSYLDWISTSIEKFEKTLHL